MTSYQIEGFFHRPWVNFLLQVSPFLKFLTLKIKILSVKDLMPTWRITSWSQELKPTVKCFPRMHHSSLWKCYSRPLYPKFGSWHCVLYYIMTIHPIACQQWLMNYITILFPSYQYNIIIARNVKHDTCQQITIAVQQHYNSYDIAIVMLLM